jgi:hypothetical protein
VGSVHGNIAKSVFCISPPGNGVDCHRVWECLYLKTIPIIRYDDCYNQFKHLPILFIDDWNSVTADFLKVSIFKFQQMLKDILPELSISYWKKNIYEQ